MKLGKQLNKLLMVHRILILIKNLWDTGVWDDLKRYVPDNEDGSKILFTNWHVSMALDAQPYGQPRVQQETWGYWCSVISHQSSTSCIFT